MRLLHTTAEGTLCLTEDLRKDIPEYAILSHRWCDEEVTYEDITNGLGKDKIGYKKLEFCAREAKRHKLKHFWVDTCCIKKSDIAELSRSITSMYSWYAKAKHCYVYLADVEDEIGSSVWFSRGWTLQELLAPRSVDFFNKNGEFLGTREELVHIIQEATGIAREALTGTPLSHFSVQERFEWAARRITFEPEDLAYCLMGIFDVSMPPLYGESVEKAFDRLKERISRKFDVDLMKMSIPGETSPHEASINYMQHGSVDYQSPSRALTLPFEPSATPPTVIGRLPRVRTMVASAMAEKVILERVAATPFVQVQQNDHSDTVAVGATEYLRLHQDIMSLQEATDDPDLKHELDSYREAAAKGAAEGLRLRTRTQDIIQYLRFTGMESRRATIKPPLSKTCHWFLDNPSYLSWREGLEPFIWMKGHPGAGKSTLIKFVDYQISNELHDSSSFVISFYFNARGNELERSVSGLYRSLIVQLLEGIPELRKVLETMYFRRKTLPHADFFQDAPIAMLRELLAACMNSLEAGNHVYCIVDALDEANEEEVLEMVEFLQHVDNESGQLSVCFASRHYPTLDLPIPAQIVIDHDPGHTHDLEHYIEVKLQAKNAGELKPVILRKANGIFMWVVLVITILNREARHGSVTTVRKRLDSLPSELIKLVKSISQQGDISNDHFILCLQWILCAKRPLRLPEFYFAMMSGMDEDASLIWYRDQIDEADMELFLITYSKGMAELSRGDVPTVQFIHESIRDFLLLEDGMSTLSEDGRQAPIPAAHDRLARCCWRAFGFGNFKECWAMKNRDRAPLFHYALAHVMIHCELSQNATLQKSFVFHFDFPEWKSWAKSISGDLMTAKDLEDALMRADCSTLLEIYQKTPSLAITGEYDLKNGWTPGSLMVKYHLADGTTMLELEQIRNIRRFLSLWEADLNMSKSNRVLSLDKTMQITLDQWYKEHKKEVRPRITSIHDHEILAEKGLPKEACYTHIFVIIHALDHAYLQLLRNVYGLLHADGIICMMFQKLDSDRSQDGQWYHDLESTRAIVRWWSKAADTCAPLIENEQIELHGSRVFTQGYRSPIIMLAR